MKITLSLKNPTAEPVEWELFPCRNNVNAPNYNAPFSVNIQITYIDDEYRETFGYLPNAKTGVAPLPLLHCMYFDLIGRPLKIVQVECAGVIFKPGKPLNPLISSVGITLPVGQSSCTIILQSPKKTLTKKCLSRKKSRSRK